MNISEDLLRHLESNTGNTPAELTAAIEGSKSFQELAFRLAQKTVWPNVDKRQLESDLLSRFRVLEAHVNAARKDNGHPHLHWNP